MSLSRLSGLDPRIRPWARYTVDLGEYYGLTPTVTSGYRSIRRQAELYRNRATNPYPVARPGTSAHNYGLAWDSSVPAAQWPWWTSLRRWVGWHVPDGDRVHAELPAWREYVPRQ